MDYLLGAMSTHLLSSPRFYSHVIHSTWHREHILWLFRIVMLNPNNHHSLLSCMCTSPVSGSITFGALSTISDTVNALFLLSFRHSLMITRSPLVHSLVSSCAKYTFLSLKYIERWWVSDARNVNKMGVTNFVLPRRTLKYKKIGLRQRTRPQCLS